MLSAFLAKCENAANVVLPQKLQQYQDAADEENVKRTKLQLAGAQRAVTFLQAKQGAFDSFAEDVDRELYIVYVVPFEFALKQTVFDHLQRDQIHVFLEMLLGRLSDATDEKKQTMNKRKEIIDGFFGDPTDLGAAVVQGEYVEAGFVYTEHKHALGYIKSCLQKFDKKYADVGDRHIRHGFLPLDTALFQATEAAFQARFKWTEPSESRALLPKNLDDITRHDKQVKRIDEVYSALYRDAVKAEETDQAKLTEFVDAVSSRINTSDVQKLTALIGEWELELSILNSERADIKRHTKPMETHLQTYHWDETDLEMALSLVSQIIAQYILDDTKSRMISAITDAKNAAQRRIDELQVAATPRPASPIRNVSKESVDSNGSLMRDLEGLATKLNAISVSDNDENTAPPTPKVKKGGARRRTRKNAATGTGKGKTAVTPKKKPTGPTDLASQLRAAQQADERKVKGPLKLGSRNTSRDSNDGGASETSTSSNRSAGSNNVVMDASYLPSEQARMANLTATSRTSLLNQ